MGILGKSRPAKKASPLKKAQLAIKRTQGKTKKAVESLYQPRTYHGKPLSAADKAALGMTSLNRPRGWGEYTPVEQVQMNIKKMQRQLKKK